MLIAGLNAVQWVTRQLVSAPVDSFFIMKEDTGRLTNERDEKHDAFRLDTLRAWQITSKLACI